MSGWVGSARLRAALLGDAFLMQAAGASTGSRELRQNLATLFRNTFKGRGPDFRTYAVQIWIEGLGRNDRVDVDNVAKACLDALTGLLWRDDRQVVRLSIEKLATGTPRITFAAEPADVRTDCTELASWLARARSE
jgi:crossover junction endodeoxyribonuclease RusA